MSLLAIDGVAAAYGRSAALHRVDLEVGAGEVVCLVGRNGMGKTSTMRAVVQEALTITAGQVRFDGASLVGRPPHEVIRHGIGYVPEDRRVFATLTVEENLRVPAPVARAAVARWSIGQVYALFPQLRDYRRRLAGVLSGGEQQMLAIGRALLTQPRLLLLDEPHEGLAPKVVDEIIGVLRALKTEGVAMLISEQSLRTIHDCADRVVVIDRGQTVYAGTVAAFESDPQLTRRYLMVAERDG